MQRPIAIDLFAGAGGMSLGFEQAGFDVRAAVEIDPVHACVHAFNFPNCAVIPQSVVGLSAETIREKAGIGDAVVDVVMGGAPCQGFSLIGQRALDDPRNELVSEFVRLVCQLEARAFVFENVKGLTLGRHRRFLDELIERFESEGYRVRSKWQVLNAADFGVPQHRERLILLGARDAKHLADYPTPLETARITCAQALGDIPDAETFDELLDGDEVEVDEWLAPSAYATTMRCMGNDAWGFGHPRVWEPNLLTSSMRTQHTLISRRRFAGTGQGRVEPISRFFKLPADGLANTLRAGTDGARGAFTSPRPIHYRYARCITVREMARLHGFPDWFRLHATKWHGARQIGNAVPPPLARAVAAKVIAALGHEPSRPSEAVELGDTALLSLDLSRASAFMEIDKPMARRDRKSPFRKRRQHEIEQEADQMPFTDGMSS